MNRRNWLDLSRKLVDQFDMDFSFTAVQEALGEAALSYWGEGVLITTTYLSPFPISLDSGDMNGAVGFGIGIDPNGQITRIDSDSTGSPVFTIPAADPTNSRWDLLVISYVATGDTPVPKPSDPITTIDLNLHDDFVLQIVEGTPASVPVYPSKPLGSIILAGIRVPPAITHANQCTVDFSIRELAQAGIFNYPVFKQEVPTGLVNGSNTVFNLSELPISNQSILIMVDDLVLNSAEFAVTGAQQVTLVTAPVVGQSIYAFYAVNQSTSQNPVTGFQEIPTGVVDGTNDTFVLAGKPITQQSTIVTVDGLFAQANTWNLVQGLTQSSIQFTAGNVPQPGQSVYVFYFVNVSPNSPFSNPSVEPVPYANYFTLDSTDISNGFVTLSNLPVEVSAVALDVIGGGPQFYNTDYTVAGQKLTWIGSLASRLAVGDVLRVTYLSA